MLASCYAGSLILKGRWSMHNYTACLQEIDTLVDINTMRQSLKQVASMAAGGDIGGSTSSSSDPGDNQPQHQEQQHISAQAEEGAEEEVVEIEL